MRLDPMNPLDFLGGARQMDPLTDAQMFLQAQATLQRGPYTADELLGMAGMAQFQPASPVVPPGWEEWYQFADECAV
jgi:hypothetical protein